ncbi:hypothetical protein B0H11DRAFT_1990690 [Mycena galericulata]|nr:hypothetical protein B0H11DRAFT_1990690 [Mycena galericulata]
MTMTRPSPTRAICSSMPDGQLMMRAPSRSHVQPRSHPRGPFVRPQALGSFPAALVPRNCAAHYVPDDLSMPLPYDELDLKRGDSCVPGSPPSVNRAPSSARDQEREHERASLQWCVGRHAKNSGMGLRESSGFGFTRIWFQQVSGPFHAPWTAD